MTVTIDDIRAAANAIQGAVQHTPCVVSHTLSEMAGAELWLKLENLQFTASFKERGALNRLLALDEADRARGVVAMSAGNHAQAVAHHATRLGIDAVIVMPRDTPFIKTTNTERLGATVVLEGETLEEAFAHAEAICREQNRVLIHPYDDPLIIAGQGTVALEILEDVPDLDTLVVPVGGGGLISGCALAAKAVKPDIEVIGVEAALFPCMRQALAGEPPASMGETIAEGIAVKRPGAITLGIIRDTVADILLAGEAGIEHAIHLLAEIEKLVVEGAGAAPLAAVLSHPGRFAGRKAGLVISGGNIDSRTLATVLMRGLIAAGRLVRLRVEAPDQPGNLARIATLVGSLGGNIVEVQHDRWFRDLPVRMTGVDILVEIRRESDAEAIIEGLAAAGYRAFSLTGNAFAPDG